MPTVLDSFVLEFGLDPSKFSAGQKDLMKQLRDMQDQSKKAGDEFEGMQKKALDLFSIMRREAIVALGGAFGVGAIVETINHFTRLETTVSRLGTQIGMSARETLAWANAFKAIGADPKAGLSALAEMNNQLVQYDITKQAPAMGIWAALGVDPYDKNRILKSPEQMMLDLAGSLERRGGDPRAKAGFLRMHGMNDDAINFLLQGTEKVRQLIDQHRKLTPEVDRYAENLKKYQEQVAALDTAWQRVGLTLTNFVSGPLTKLMDKFADVLNRGAEGVNKIPEKSLFGRMFKYFGFGASGTDGNLAASPEASAPRSIGDKRAMIEQIFGAQGIDPRVAFDVAQHEGLYNYFGDKDASGRPTSFGDFQLHFSGNPNKPALGDIFQKETGLDPRDPTTTRAQYEFIAKWVKKHGWGDFMGARAVPGANLGPRASAGGSVTNNNYVTVNDKSGNPGKQAGLALEHIKRANLAYGVGTVAQG